MENMRETPWYSIETKPIKFSSFNEKYKPIIPICSTEVTTESSKVIGCVGKKYCYISFEDAFKTDIE